MFATYKDLIKCTNNPSTEFPKYIKKHFGVNRKFKIAKTTDGMIYVLHCPEDELTKPDAKGWMKLKKSGAMMTPFFRIIQIGTKKNAGYYILGKGKKIQDITQEFVEAYIKTGMCSYSDHKHNFEKVSPRIRVCQACGLKEKYQKVVKVDYEWKRVVK